MLFGGGAGVDFGFGAGVAFGAGVGVGLASPGPDGDGVVFGATFAGTLTFEFEFLVGGAALAFVAEFEVFFGTISRYVPSSFGIKILPFESI
mgnify:CR=1 FL=1